MVGAHPAGHSPRGLLAIGRSQCGVAAPPCRPRVVHSPCRILGVHLPPCLWTAGGAVSVAGGGQAQQAARLCLSPGGRGWTCPVGGATLSPRCEGQVQSEQSDMFILCTQYLAKFNGTKFTSLYLPLK